MTPVWSWLEHEATAYPALGHGPVGVSYLVQGQDLVHPGRQLARRGAGEHRGPTMGSNLGSALGVNPAALPRSAGGGLPDIH